MTLGVLISGSGTNLQALCDAIDSNLLPARIGVVISNKRDAYGIIRARNSGIPVRLIVKEDFYSQSDYDNALLSALNEYGVQLVVLAGFLSILSENVVCEYRNKIINVHPSLIPAFCGKGFYGRKVHEAVIDYGVKLTGATVHFVDEGADTGPIILQESVVVDESDDVSSLSKKVLKVEHRLLVESVKLFAEGRLCLEGRKVRVKTLYGGIYG